MTKSMDETGTASTSAAASFRFRRYGDADRQGCLALFDANCSDYFAPNERADYEQFLERHGTDYRLVTSGDTLCGGFAVIRQNDRARINWILVSPAAQGSGAGRAMMMEALAEARAMGVSAIDIAASHLSAPFFARFGARALSRQDNGWGPGMHRVDMELAL